MSSGTRAFLPPVMMLPQKKPAGGHPTSAKRLSLGGGNVSATLFPDIGRGVGGVGGGRHGQRRKAGGNNNGRRLEPIRVKKSRKKSAAAATAAAPVPEEKDEEERSGKKPKSPNIGFGVTLWLHRFIFRTNPNRMSAGRRAEEVAKMREPEKATANSEASAVPAMTVFPKPVIVQERVGNLPATAGKGNNVAAGNNWNTLRSRLIRAKITDAFENLKFEVQGKTYTALRTLGEGGYSKVYEVFNKEKELYALKVCSKPSVSACHNYILNWG